MLRFKCLNFIFIISCFILYNCGGEKSKEEVIPSNQISSDSNMVSLQFSFVVVKDVYQKTNFGQPPQMAIWIENLDTSIVKTVWITHRTAKQDWKGKVECPVSLPIWEYRIKLKKKTAAGTVRKSNVDAVSTATPKEGKVVASMLVPKDSQWNYYIEVNVSADYNKTFTYWSQDGLPDSEANGQPSIIYSGNIIADLKSRSIPVLIGRTNQGHAVTTISKDLSGITSAKHLIKKMLVTSGLQTKTESTIDP